MAQSEATTLWSYTYTGNSTDSIWVKPPDDNHLCYQVGIYQDIGMENAVVHLNIEDLLDLYKNLANFLREQGIIE